MKPQYLKPAIALLSCLIMLSCSGNKVDTERQNAMQACEKSLEADVTEVSIELVNASTMGLGGIALDVADKKEAFGKFIYSKVRPAVKKHLNELSTEELKAFSKDSKQRMILIGKKIYENKDVIITGITEKYAELSPFISSLTSALNEIQTSQLIGQGTENN